MSRTYRQLTPTLQRLGAATLRQLWRHALQRPGNPESDSVLGDGDCLLLWLAQVLSVRRLLPPDQQMLVLEEYAAEVREHGDQLGVQLRAGSPEKSGEKRTLCAAMLSILDCGLTRLSGQSRYFDLQQACYVSSPARPPIEFLSIDLTALFVRTSYLLDHAARPESTPVTPSPVAPSST
jgi:hypothetical protein